MNIGPERGRLAVELLTVGEAYARIVRPYWQAEGRAAATFREYATAVSKWGEFWRLSAAEPSVCQTEGSAAAGGRCGAGGPPVGQLGRAEFAAFRCWLSAGGASTRTANKRTGEVGAIVAAAADLGGFTPPPRVRPLRCRLNNGKPYLTSAEVDAVYAAAEAATWPRRAANGRPIDTAAHWRAAIVLFWFYGFRTQELLSVERDHCPLTWGGVYPPGRSPTGSRAESPAGWLVYTPQKQRRAKPDPLVLPLHPVAADHLAIVGGACRIATAPVFNWYKSPKQFSAAWAQIVAASGVRLAPTIAEASPRLTLSVFRKTCATAHNANARGLAPLVLGHSPRGSAGVVTDTFYDNPEAAILAAFSSLVFPRSFLPTGGDPRQLRLF